MEKQTLQYWRQSLKDNFAAIQQHFLASNSPAKLFKHHSNFTDGLLLEIWQSLNISETCTLIAVGGYGRGELYPHSDIDLLILLPSNNPENSASVEAFVGLLWDIGLSVGHSVRTLDECISEAEKDITVQTNLIESRLIAGRRQDYEAFAAKVEASINVADFFKAKIQEQDNRHAKFNDTAYSLEPNLKESPGGLRDLHMILWLTYALKITKPLTSGEQISKSKHKTHEYYCWLYLQKQGYVSALELRQILRNQKNLQALRIRLHFLSNRREDRLLFDYQNTLATDLGYSNTARKRASEQLMQSYYRSVKSISLMNEILIKTLKLAVAKTQPVIVELNDYFQTHNDLLEVKHANYLQQNPSAILKAFLLLQQTPSLQGMGANLLRNMQRVKKLVNHDFRQNPVNKKLFISLLMQPNGVNHTLRAMNHYGILGSYIPAFGKIIGQMQHDLFHVYTVDEHILNVLANLRRFAKPDLKHEFPLCTQLFSAFDSPHLLYLAAIFHDIAKGRGGDHSTLGTVDAKRFCKLHHLSKEDTELVAWLVDAHLKMSSTAQKSDLSDPAVIESFATLVKDERRLTALYLLTVADIRGTSPAVWNAWKARLLESLYFATKEALSNIDVYSEQTIQARKEDAIVKLNQFDLNPAAYQPLWDNFGVHYFSRHESDEIAWHSRLLTPHLNTQTAIVRARLSRNGDGIQVMIYTKDQTDLFARMCNFFDRMAYSIAAAKIYTTDHGYALDTFIILDESGKSVSYKGLLKFIETELTQKLTQNASLESPLKGRVSRQVKHMPITAKLSIKKIDDYQHQLDIVTNDKPGLLATLALKLLSENIVLHTAKINTLGNRAEDTFLISAINHQPLNTATIEKLQQTLLNDV